MIDADVGMPSELIRDFTSALWRVVQEDGNRPLSEAPEIRRMVRRGAEPAWTPELQALVDRTDKLEPAEQREFAAALDDVQVSSKLWLIDELTRVRPLAGVSLFVLGAWHGILPLLLNWRLDQRPARMVCVDISAQACALGQEVVGSLYDNIEYVVADAMDLDYSAIAQDRSSVLVNTICEHLADAATWWRRIPAGQLVALQSNDYDACPDHVNCVRDLGEMKAQTPLSKELYAGVLKLPIFDRFMLIGYR